LAGTNFGVHEKMPNFLQKLWRLAIFGTDVAEKTLANSQKNVHFRVKKA